MQHSIPRFAGPKLCKAAGIDSSHSLTELKAGKNGPRGYTLIGESDTVAVYRSRALWQCPQLLK